MTNRETDLDEQRLTATPQESENIPIDQLDKETAEKLRGDAIGNTMYSETFVLKTLLQLSDIVWSKDLEDSLCSLWDMTEEEDICQYLFNLNFPSLAATTILAHDENRLIEILIGIVANLLCSKCDKKLDEKDVRIILNFLNSDDPLILIQVLRFLHALMFMSDDLDCIDDDVIENLNFILLNSQNRELVLHTLKTVAVLLEDKKLDTNIIKSQLLKSSLIAYRLIVNLNFNGENVDHMLGTRYLLQLICGLFAYIDESPNSVSNECKAYQKDLIDIIVDILNYYKNKEFLLPVTEDFTFYIEAQTFICRSLNLFYYKEIFIALFEIFTNLMVNEVDNLDEFAELLCYFISQGVNNQITQDLKLIPNYKNVLNYIETHNFKYDFEYKTYLKQLLD